MFNPAEYHFDPEIYKAHLATQEATKRATPSFATGFTGGQDLSTLKGFGAWGTGGLSGQLITKALAGDKEVEFFIQRHGVDFGLSELNKQIEALNKEASLRPLSSKEQAYLKEAELKREEVVSGLQFAKEHLGGDLDAPMYEDGTSFNESWGISSNEEIGLSQFFETLRKHPEHTAGAIVGELVKDFPLTAASIFG